MEPNHLILSNVKILEVVPSHFWREVHDCSYKLLLTPWISGKGKRLPNTSNILTAEELCRYTVSWNVVLQKE